VVWRFPLYMTFIGLDPDGVEQIVQAPDAAAARRHMVENYTRRWNGGKTSGGSAPRRRSAMMWVSLVTR
jgi:hypothetical protein